MSDSKKVGQTSGHSPTAKKPEAKAVGEHHTLDRVSQGKACPSTAGHPTQADHVEHEKKQSKVGEFVDHLKDGFTDLFGGGKKSDEPKKSMREQFKPSVLEQPKTEGQVSEILKQNFNKLDTAGGSKKDGIFTSRELEKVANDKKASPELRAAAQQVLDDPNLYHGLDAAAGRNIDDRISKADLNKAIANEKELKASSAAPPTFKQLADGLSKNFDTFDAAKNGVKDGKVSREDLTIIANTSKDEKQKLLAKQLLADQATWDALDIGDKKWDKDGVVSKNDLKQARNAANIDDKPRDTWTADSEKALDAVLKDGSLDGADLFKGFHQTNKGNCATTAVIKGAIDHYGKDIFKDVDKGKDGSYSVELQDGSKVKVTREELQAAAAGAHYALDEPGSRAFTTLTYAVMAKRAQELGHEKSKTFGEALVSLSNGESPTGVPEFLGLQDKMKRIPIEEARGKDGVVAFGDGHCIYVDTLDGATYGDAWGEQREYDGTNYVTKENGIEKVGHLSGAYIFT